ncbi:MAG: type II toxin-antitoxin system HicB family antitoxin [Dehalococcoidia bacterium]
MKTLDEYLEAPYHIVMVRDGTGGGDPGWVTWVDELPGCVSQGDSPEEAAAMIREAMEAWIGTALEDGDPIPEPRPIEDYSGRFLVRLPSSLHAALDGGARREGVSMNQYVTALLAGAVGWQANSASPKRKTKAS